MIYHLKYFCMMIFIRKKRQWNDICDFPSIVIIDGGSHMKYFIQWHNVKLFQGKQIYMEAQYMYIDIELWPNVTLYLPRNVYTCICEKKDQWISYFYRNQVRRQFIGSEYGSLMEKVTSWYMYILQCRYFYTYI